MFLFKGRTYNSMGKFVRLTLFSHELEVRLPALLLVHIYKGLIAVLMLGEVGTNLLTDLEVSVGGAIELVRECAEEAVAVPEGVDRIEAHLRQLVFQPLLVLHGIVDNLIHTTQRERGVR